MTGSHYRGHLSICVRTFYPQLGERQEMQMVNGTRQSVYCFPKFLTNNKKSIHIA
ncbi:hypothetical protein GXM_08612 [Nostoc sphaeroides CCNUC1]|uniref:Uncharacterized protein n=1 Tax=Nostoc sphaeroides CCNUC1 TaxID=2653204 RepID=A0A5P8WED4_9NOSO|nr:hypothetical protein GXM_08612 [Nostoc sphaeroides CCNUC1]